MDAMFYEVFAEEKEALARVLPRDLIIGFSANTVQSDGRTFPPSGLISIRTQSVIPPAWAKALSGILTRSSGFDHLLAFRNRVRHKISYGYLPSYCERSVAEQTLLMVLALARKLKKQLAHFGTFNRDDLTGVECLRRRLLVVGVGRIGGEIARLAKGVGMHVQGVDLVKKVPTLDYVTLRRGVSSADVIVCALPLTQRTEGLFSYKLLRGAKKGTLFVNISRGEISPIRDLKRLLEECILGGVGLDVYEGESGLAECLRKGRGGILTQSGKEILSLKKDDRVLLTPHNAFNTQEAVERKAKRSSEAIVAFLKKGSFPNPVPIKETNAQ